MPFFVLYVHAQLTAGLFQGSKVKRTQRIGVPVASNGHFHFGLKNKTGKAPHPEPMEYLERNRTIKTRYAEIEKVWFKDGKFNWSLFPDRHIPGTEPVVDPCLARLSALQQEHAAQMAVLRETNARKVADMILVAEEYLAKLKQMAG